MIEVQSEITYPKMYGHKMLLRIMYPSVVVLVMVLQGLCAPGFPFVIRSSQGLYNPRYTIRML